MEAWLIKKALSHMTVNNGSLMNVVFTKNIVNLSQSQYLKKKQTRSSN